MASPNLVFMGVCGCGKSTVAELYARHTDAVLIEADFFHPPENIAKMSAGTPLTDADRAGWLAALATRIADGKGRGEAMVVTCSALKKAYRDRLRAGDPELLFVFLDGGQELLQARLNARKGHFMPSSLLGSQLATLERPDPTNEICLQVVAVRVMRLGPSALDTARRMWRGERLGEEERPGEAARRRLHLCREAPRLGAATLVATKVVGDVHVPAGATTFYVPLEGHSEQRRFEEEPILPVWPSAASGAVPSTSAGTLPLEAKPLWKGYGCLAAPGFRSSQYSEGRLQVLDAHRFVFSWLGEIEHVYHRLPDQWDS
eukprot:jgi/Chrpa1/14949/Chrysochromulina_OHIO_Genome00022420-RA